MKVCVCCDGLVSCLGCIPADSEQAYVISKRSWKDLTASLGFYQDLSFVLIVAVFVNMHLKHK